VDGHPVRPSPTRLTRLLRVAGAALLTPALVGCWPAVGQGPDRRGHNPFETVIDPTTVQSLAPVWTATTDSEDSGGVVGGPVVSSSGVHVSDGTAVHSFAKADGTRLWVSPSSPVIFGAVADPIADGGRVLVSAGFPVGFGGSWTAFASWHDARTGTEVAAPPAARITSRRGTRLAAFSTTGGPFVGLLVFSLSVIDETDPNAGWGGTLRFATGSFEAAPPATLGAQRLYYAGTATESYDPLANVTGVRAFPLTPPGTCALPPQGAPLGPIPCPLWSTPTTGRPVTSPVLGPGESVLYVGTAAPGTATPGTATPGTAGGSLLALDAADGHVLWTAPLAAAPSAEPALADGWLYVPLADGSLVVLPAAGCGAATCDPAWQATLGGTGLQPAVAGGVVLVGTDTGHLVALPAAGCGQPTCPPLGDDDLGAPVTGAPAVTGGRVYVGVSPDQVIALAPT
jgi:outer membrane protein assembly factor BamB